MKTTSTTLDKLGALALQVGGDRRATCYLAGPMRGYPEYNFPAFHAGAAELRAAGWTVFSPAERDEADPNVDLESEAVKQGLEVNGLAYYMQFDLPAVCNSDAVFLLPGWEASVGARLEVRVALAVEKRVFTLEDLAEFTLDLVKPVSG